MAVTVRPALMTLVGAVHDGQCHTPSVQLFV
ncbi:hypothetical protein BH23ACT3_BH23ACT3_17450 [soil metagenome]